MAQAWSETMKVDGRCLCGAITYEAEVEPGTIQLCHCEDCQMQTGSAFRANVPAPAHTFKLLTGEPHRYFKTVSNGSKRVHAFCGNCGGPVYSAAAENPQSYTLRIGALKQKHELGVPRRQIWAKREFDWLKSIDHVPKVNGQP
jgi:hypothetical protein